MESGLNFCYRFRPSFFGKSFSQGKYLSFYPNFKKINHKINIKKFCMKNHEKNCQFFAWNKTEFKLSNSMEFYLIVLHFLENLFCMENNFQIGENVFIFFSDSKKHQKKSNSTFRVEKTNGITRSIRTGITAPSHQ